MEPERLRKGGGGLGGLAKWSLKSRRL
jgi:hypothetical protein